MLFIHLDYFVAEFWRFSIEMTSFSKYNETRWQPAHDAQNVKIISKTQQQWLFPEIMIWLQVNPPTLVSEVSWRYCFLSTDLHWISVQKETHIWMRCSCILKGVVVVVVSSLAKLWVVSVSWLASCWWVDALCFHLRKKADFSTANINVKQQFTPQNPKWVNGTTGK